MFGGGVLLCLLTVCSCIQTLGPPLVMLFKDVMKSLGGKAWLRKVYQWEWALMVYGLPVCFLCSVFSWDVVFQFSVSTTCRYSFMPRWTLILLELSVRRTAWVLKLLLIVVLYPRDKNVIDTPRLKAFDKVKFSMEVGGSRILGVWQLLWNLTLKFAPERSNIQRF